MNRVKLLTVCCLGLVLLTGFPGLTQEYPCDVYIRSAKIYLHTQNPPDFESALKNLQAAYDKCYGDPYLHVLMGMIYADKNQIEKMAKEFSIANQQGYADKKAIKDILESKWSENFKNGANLLNQLDKAPTDSVRLVVHKMALQHFENCIFIDSSKYQPFVNAAAEYIALGNSPKADTLLAWAYQLAPESLNVVLGYGINLYNLARKEEAIAIFEKAVEIDPNNREALMNLASLYGEVGNKEKSEEIWNALIDKGIADKNVFFNRGMVFLGQAENSITKMQELAKSAKGNSKNLNVNAELSKLNAEKDESLKGAALDFERTVELDSLDQEAMYYLGYIYMLQEQFDQAQITLEKVINKEPNNAQAWQKLAIVYNMKGMKDKAVEAAKKADAGS